MFHLLRFFLVALLLCSVASPGSAQTGVPENGQGYNLGPGDVLNVQVYGEPEVSSNVVIRMDGRISLPLAGELQAAGRTPKELSDEIRGKLERFIEAPEVTVILAESQSKRYYVLGQVESPGEYDINHPVTVVQAIARAGGFLEWARTKRIMIVGVSGEEEEITYFDYDGFLKRPERHRNIVIQPGDTIVVP